MEKETSHTVGILVSSAPWSTAALVQTNGSKRPLILLQLEGDNPTFLSDVSGGQVHQAVLNLPAKQLLPRLSLAKQYKSDIDSGFEVALVYKVDDE